MTNEDRINCRSTSKEPPKCFTRFEGGSEVSERGIGQLRGDRDNRDAGDFTRPDVLASALVEPHVLTHVDRGRARDERLAAAGAAQEHKLFDGLLGLHAAEVLKQLFR